MGKKLPIFDPSARLSLERIDCRSGVSTTTFPHGWIPVLTSDMVVCRAWSNGQDFDSHDGSMASNLVSGTPSWSSGYVNNKINLFR